MKQCMLIVFDPHHVRRSVGHCSKGGDSRVVDCWEWISYAAAGKGLYVLMVRA